MQGTFQTNYPALCIISCHSCVFELRFTALEDGVIYLNLSQLDRLRCYQTGIEFTLPSSIRVIFLCNILLVGLAPWIYFVQ